MTSIASAHPDRRTPGRPRSARAEQAIIEAVRDLLSEGTSVEAISVESVAARAGVGKATIYRRWSSKEEMIMEAVTSLKPPPPELAGESVRDDLVALLRTAGQQPDSQRPGLMTCLMPEVTRNPKLNVWYQTAVEQRREVMRAVLRRGIGSGELRDDLDIEVTLSQLVGPILIQRMLRWNPLLDQPDLPERVVDAVLAGAGPR